MSEFQPLGRYATTTLQNASWLKDNAPGKRKVTNYSGRNNDNEISLEGKDIIYYSLLEGTQYITDPEWRKIITRAAYGILPLRFSHRGDGISYNYGGKRTTVQLSDEPYEAVNQIINLFRMSGGIKTQMDYQYEQQQFQANMAQTEMKFWHQGWSDLKPKVKLRAIDTYTSKLVREQSMAPQGKDLLYTIINWGLTNQSIRDSDIVFERGVIINIIVLFFDEKNKQFYIRSDALARAKVPVQKGFYTDQVYFSPRRCPIRNAGFKGFSDEWSKFNRNHNRPIGKQKILTGRGTERPPSSSPYPVPPTPSNSRESMMESDYVWASSEDSLLSRQARISSDESGLVNNSNQMGLSRISVLLSPRPNLPGPRSSARLAISLPNPTTGLINSGGSKGPRLAVTQPNDGTETLTFPLRGTAANATTPSSLSTTSSNSLMGTNLDLRPNDHLFLSHPAEDQTSGTITLCLD